MWCFPGWWNIINNINRWVWSYPYLFILGCLVVNSFGLKMGPLPGWCFRTIAMTCLDLSHTVSGSSCSERSTVFQPTTPGWSAGYFGCKRCLQAVWGATVNPGSPSFTVGSCHPNWRECYKCYTMLTLKRNWTAIITMTHLLSYVNQIFVICVCVSHLFLNIQY